MATLELTREQIAQPTFEQRRNTTQEKQPDPPAWRPKAAARPFAHRPRIKSIIYEMLQVFAHANLLHELVLIAVHARELTHVREYIL